MCSMRPLPFLSVFTESVLVGLDVRVTLLQTFDQFDCLALIFIATRNNTSLHFFIWCR